MVLIACAACAAGQDLALQGIAQVGFRVSDLARIDAFYSGVLGLPRSSTSPDGAVLYKVNEQQSLEMAPGATAQDTARLTHVVLQTADIKAVRQRLGSSSVQAPEGTRIDFIEYGPGSQGGDGSSYFHHLQHVGVIVDRSRVAASLHFYRDTLGCSEFWRYEPTPGDLRLIKLLVPGQRRDIIEMMIASGTPTRAQAGSMQHINFEVPDIHTAYRFVLARDRTLPKTPRPRVNAEDIWAFNLFDPDGTRVEVQDLTKIPMTSLNEETFHGRRAWVLSNGWMRVSVLAGGGHIAEVRLLSDDPKKSVNPMRVPHYPTIEPYLYDPARDDAVYGDTPHRWLSSGYMGHLLCFPIYGAPSAQEALAGLGNHGEAPIVEWRKTKAEVNAEGVTLWYGADLPKTQFRVERAVHLPRGMRSVRVEEWVENKTAFDRPINWMEHATFGPPFIEPGKTMLDASATRGQVAEDASGTGSLRSGSAVAWPRGVAPDGEPADLRPFQAKPHSGTYVALRLDPARTEQFFTLYHPDFRVLIGYVFPAEGNSWLADWQENRRSTVLPWNGQVVARGLEFGSSPFAEGLRASVERGSLFDTPAYRWIGARQRLKTEFTIVLEEIPDGFRGVGDLRTENGVPILRPRE